MSKLLTARNRLLEGEGPSKISAEVTRSINADVNPRDVSWTIGTIDVLDVDKSLLGRNVRIRNTNDGGGFDYTLFVPVEDGLNAKETAQVYATVTNMVESGWDDAKALIATKAGSVEREIVVAAAESVAIWKRPAVYVPVAVATVAAAAYAWWLLL